MIAINLLRDIPARNSESLNPLWSGILGCVSTILVLLMISSWTWYTVRQRDETFFRRSALLEQSHQLKRVRHQLEQLQSEKVQLEERRSSLKDLEINRSRPLRIMNVVAASVPSEPTLWLTRLVHEHRKLKVTGQARGVEEIADFVDNLSRAGIFETVELNYWEKEAQFLHFEVSCLSRLQL